METGSAFGVDGGVQMLSDTYAGNIYPISDSDLILQGRTAPNGYVKVRDCNEFTMTSGGIAKINTIQAVGSTTDAVTVDVLQSNFIVADTGNLTITGKTNVLVPNYRVDISMANTLAFDATGAGSITGVQSINGAAWPPPSGDASLWSQYRATSTIDASGFGITNLTSINGVPYVAANTEQWATFPAVQTVDLSTNAIINVAGITTLDNANIVSAGALGIFSDVSGDLSLAAAGGGNVNIGNGGLGNINIVAVNQTTTVGGKNVILTSSEGLALNDLSGVVFTTPKIEVGNANINGVQNINGANTITITSAVDIALESANDVVIEAQAGSANLTGQIDANVTATTGIVNITGGTSVDIASDTNIGRAGFPHTLTVTGSANATGDVVSSYGGSFPYSLNTIGALVTTPQTYNYWVSVNGSNTTGTGSVTNPFATITAALAATSSLADGIPVNINVTAGTYTENPTITRNNTFIIGTPTVSDVVIIGTLSLTPAASAQPLITQGGSGLTVVGNVICSETVNTEVNWYLANVNVTSYGVNALAATGDVNNNCSITMNSCVITQNTTNSAAIQLVSCRANLVLVSVAQNTTSPAVSLFSGNSSIAANGATFTCAGTALASPVVNIGNTISAGSLNTFTSCSFIYTASTVGVGKTGVAFTNAVVANAVFNYCVFSVGGSTNIISKTGIGSTNVTWGHNTCTSVSTVPVTSVTLTYSYSAQDFIRANTLRDSANSAGTGGQVLSAGSAGGSLTWSSLGPTSLGALTALPAATAYQNSLVTFNTTTNTLTYDTPGFGVQVTAVSGVALALNPAQRGRRFILTSGGAASQSIAVGPTFSINDTNFFCIFQNGNGTAGGDITLNGVTGNNVLHNQTAIANGGQIVVTYDGTRFNGY